MKKIPSFRSQIFVVFFVLLIFAILFTRSFFIKSNYEFLSSLSGQDVMTKLDSLYINYSPALSSEYAADFGRDVETLMLSQKAINISSDIYRRQIESYSRYIFFFVLLAGFGIFILSINLITRPLIRLQNATQELMSGEKFVQIKENRLSPLNDLIVSFNTMVRELNRQQEIAINAEKQLVWREIARVMAHEIKNPLTPIKLSVERLERSNIKNNSIDQNLLKESIGIIKEEIANLQSLVNRFHGFAALPAARPEEYNLYEQVCEIAAPYRSQGTISIQTDSEEAYLYADKLQIKQALVNLIQNALQAADSPDIHINISIMHENNRINLELKDNGPGISTENLSKIFEPYFTTKRKGTGLGLPIVKRIVENHNGKIFLESRAGYGTTVRITLPIKYEEG